MDNKTLIKQYVGIVQKIARVEHRRIPNHMIEYEELVSIGIIAIQTLIKVLLSIFSYLNLRQFYLDFKFFSRFLPTSKGGFAVSR